MVLERIETLIKDKIGISVSVIDSKEITRVVEKRRLACNLPDWQTYLEYLQTSTQELEELIELVIVPETWFFRDREPFAFLERYVQSEWLPTNGKKLLRLLSVPCSSGEEPYSIAMALFKAGLTPNQFIIDAVDISKKSLAKAKAALYSSNSFRGNNLEFQSHYFDKIADKYQLCDLLKRTVNFIHGNLVEPSFLMDKQPYNIIFCRNVLIYFEHSAREKSIANLERLLTNQGLIFMGHAETLQMFSSQFESVRQPFTFAYWKIDKNKEQLNVQLTNPDQAKIRFKSDRQQQVQSQTINPLERVIPHKPQPLSINLETIRSLADRGELSEAAKLCENYLYQNSTRVEAYVLLGQIYQAQGKEKQAQKSFQKAIYLKPSDYDALMHLALLKENQGEIASAVLLRQRIQRLNR